MRIRDHTPLIVLGAFAVCLLITWWAYYPGLAGGYLFDDYANLPSLGAYGPVDNLPTFWRYITSGIADPSGRPIALLSFLIDGNDWPTDPFPFKRTAVLLHLCNGSLLALLLYQLGNALRYPKAQASGAAALGAALWLLHPLFVSTTLYIVQREAMLPATFILLGLLGYMRGRSAAESGQRWGIVLAAASIGLATLLAALSKANGALLPLFALLIEWLILAPRRPITHPRTKRFFSAMRSVTLILPSVLITAYLIYMTYIGFTRGMPAIRPWTLGQRLLTESRILVDYLSLLWLPRPFTSGLFNDAFSVSKGLLSPLTTLLSLVAIATLLIGAWVLRHRHPALALAIFFFFAGHLIESTVVPLELYFEHRNYVPALLMFWPLSLWICGNLLSENILHERRDGTVLVLLSFALLLILPIGAAMMTRLGASLWGNTREQALIWAQKNPVSPRAQAYAAQIEIAHGQAIAATARLEDALTRNPEEIQLALNLIGAKCQGSSLNSEDIGKAETALRTASNTGRLGYDWFQRGLSIAQSGSCPGLNLDTLDSLLQAAAQNPRTEKVPGRVQDRLHLQARIALLKGDAPHALDLFDRALDSDIRPGAALEQAAILARANQPELAEKHLDHLNAVWKRDAPLGFNMVLVHAWVLSQQGYWPQEIDHLRKQLDEDISANKRAQSATSL